MRGPILPEHFAARAIGGPDLGGSSVPRPKGGAMPNITATIDRHQRDGLYELVRNHLGSVGDLWNALEQEEDFATAERLGMEFSEDFRLLADIGWQPTGRPRVVRADDAAARPDGSAEAPARRSRGRALGSGTERESREADAETDARFQLGLDACEEVLVGLGREGEPA